MNDKGITWIASYPKSGNTWVRFLLEAYRSNGHIDINDARLARADGGAQIINCVSPQPIGPLELEGELLLRPAGLLNLIAHNGAGVFVKTHFCNLQRKDCPPSIPPQWTHRAVYIVRDPRSVLLSGSKFFGMSLDKMAEAMANKDFVIGGTDEFARTWVSSWTNHVASWVGEKNFPVHIVRYEDLQQYPVSELKGIIEFLGDEFDPVRGQAAVDATRLSKLREQEEKDGFKENVTDGKTFFGTGRDWKSEIGARWSGRIEDDHSEVMHKLGYE